MEYSIPLPNSTDLVALRGELLTVVPVTGTMTVTSGTSVAIKAGTSSLSGRKKLIIKNLSDSVQIRIGASSASAIYTSGIPLEPRATVEIDFDPSTAVELYARSIGYAVDLEVTES
jgi:hypothetical protein